MASSGLVGRLAGKAEREAFWREHVGAWRDELERAERAGREPVTVREFCRGRGLREPSFYFWRRELSRRELAGRELAGRVGTPAARREPVAIFAPVTVRPASAKAPEPSPIELEVGGVTLRVPPNFDEATLARLIAVLRA
jgi:transposase-like protein